MMGPTIIRWSLANTSDFDIWTKAELVSKELNFEQAKVAIAAQQAEYADLLSGLTDADFRTEVTDFDGKKTSRGAFLTNLVLGGCAAYRMRLFLLPQGQQRARDQLRELVVRHGHAHPGVAPDVCR